MENSIEKLKVHLELPTEEYKESFLEALSEFHEEGLFMELSKEELQNDFKSFLKKIEDKSKGINLKEGKVPESVFWIIDNDGYVGSVNLRHDLNDHLKFIGGHIGYKIRPSKRKLGYGYKALEMILPEAKKLGLDKVLLTCDKDNISSIKIIEKSNGILDSEDFDEKSGKEILRYWINL
jgi:predicted acetyltransferase